MIRAAGRYLGRHHVALLALVLSLGGTAYAADAITGRDVQNGSLSGADVRNGSLSGHDIRDGSIAPRDLSANAVPTVTYSASVVGGGGSPQLYTSYGFSTVRHTATGVYVVGLDTSKPIAPDCNYVASSFAPTGGSGTATVAIAESDATTVTVALRGASGTPADLGPAFGYDGFTVLANCPVAGGARP